VDINEIGWKAVNSTELALDRDKWRALVNTENKYFCSTKYGEIFDYLTNY